MNARQPLAVLIADIDTLRSSGLRRLLRDNHRAEVTVCTAADLRPDMLSSFNLIFTDPDTLAAMPDLFTPRRDDVVILSPRPSTWTTLDPTSPHDILIESLATIVNTIGSASRQPLSAQLSARELDVLRLVAMGYINKEIADTLNISFNTVLTHRRNITSKLGIKSSSGLGVYALMNGFIAPTDIRH